MSKTPEQVVREFCAAFAVSDVDELVSFFADDAVYIDGPRATHHGIDAIRTEIASQVRMIPTAVVDITTLLERDGVVIIERVDNFEVAGEPFALDVAAVFTIDEAGHITRWRDYYDLQSIAERTAAALQGS
jgi:limonene-1,2-epoxide hydrolase